MVNICFFIVILECVIDVLAGNGIVPFSGSSSPIYTQIEPARPCKKRYAVLDQRDLGPIPSKYVSLHAIHTSVADTGEALQ